MGQIGIHVVDHVEGARDEEMLTYLLIWTVALGSIAIYAASYIFPELYRKNDLLWAGIGLFYALILWVYAGRFNGGLLLGQTAGVSMFVWLGWQAMVQRRELTPVDQRTPVPDWLQKIIDVVAPLWTKVTTTISTTVSDQLGLEPTDTEKPPAPLTWVELKEKATTLFKGGATTVIDAESTTTDAISTEVTTDDDEDWEEDDEAVATAETVTPEAVAPPTAPPAVPPTVEPPPEVVQAVEPQPESVQPAQPTEVSASEPMAAAPAVAQESVAQPAAPPVAPAPADSASPDAEVPSTEASGMETSESPEIVGGADEEPAMQPESMDEPPPREDSNWPPEPMN
jgi:hypothetical protein